MDFQRIDKNTVQCRMTEEEMNSFGFEIEDFFTNQEKSREFLEQIVEKAEEEVGYEVESGMVSMQLMRMPDNSLTITFTDRGEDGIQNMLHQIQNLAGMIDDTSAEVIVDELKHDKDNIDNDKEIIKQSENMDEFQKNNTMTEEEKKKAYQKHLKEIDKKKRAKEKKIASSSKVFVFDSLHNIEQFADTLNMTKIVSSKVYKDVDSGKYYLLIKKGKLKLEEYTKICQQLTEYSKLSSQQVYVEQYCKEHFECLIPKHALKILKEY